ncbi:MAG: DUF1553 domain-containing protein [Planctomyces sp.]
MSIRMWKQGAWCRPLALMCVAFWLFFSVRSVADEAISFNRDIRPILADHCFSCHGPDAGSRRGGLRLDQRDSAVGPAESGRAAIVPGDVSGSQLLVRIHATDAELVMPPPQTGKSLSVVQRQMLERWIAAGAEYQSHWSLVPPQASVVPQTGDDKWSRTEIDRFIFSRLRAEGLQPSAPAGAHRLLRRLSLDLTGLPPTLAEADAFADELRQAALLGAAAEDQVVRRWIDQLFRSPHYGERMAVDWLDAARYADTNGYQVDRDRELWAWRDWVIAAFNSNQRFDQFTTEQLAGDLLPDATVAQRVATGFHRNHMLNEEGGVIPEEFLAEYCADRAETTASIWLGQTLMCARCHDHKYDAFTQKDYYSLYAFFHSVNEKGIGNYGAPIRRNAPPFLPLPTVEQQAKQVELQGRQRALAEQLAAADQRLRAEQSAWEQEQLQAEKLAALPAEIREIVLKAAADRSAAETGRLEQHRQASDAERVQVVAEQAAVVKSLAELEQQTVTTLVMEELAVPRETRILMRGEYSKPGEVVTAETPASLPPMSSEWPKNRLGLAKWLVDPGHPLTARVIVNRLWQQLFGVGLVRTSEDFGVQGEAPSHPELLDWLAVEFVRSGWDVQHMLRLMASSAVYRQSSVVTEQLRQRDPDNRLLARGPRFRLQAEFLRDQALCVSGLLVRKVGGPSVKPYHPPGLYEQVTAGSGTNVYVEGQGEDLYRRSLYTYWKRSVPHPAMLLFDAPFREACTLRRSRTNTPLQALNLLNDPTWVEAARFLAGRMLAEGGGDVGSQLRHGFRLALIREPEERELGVLRAGYERVLVEFRESSGEALGLLQFGAARSAENLPQAELAAMTVTAGVVLNLHEAVTRE